MPQQTVWLARHGTREDMVNPEWRKTAARPFDVPLASKGHAEARRLGVRLVGEKIDVIYASPFLRTVQTAAAVAAEINVPIRLEPGVGEWLHEPWFEATPVLMPAFDTGFTSEHLDDSYQSPWQMAWPEPWEKVIQRTHATMQRLLAGGENFLIIGHGASVVGCTAALLSAQAPHDPPPAPPTGLFRYDRHGDDWRTILEADVSHLDPPQE